MKRQWREAATAYAEMFAAGPTDDGEAWFEYAAVQLLAGDEEAYRKTCAHMRERCGKSPSMRPYLVARACTLGDVGAENVEAARRLSAGEMQRNGVAFWSLTEQGALIVRSGRPKDAVPLFERSLVADAAVGRAVLNWLWLALAHAKLGDAAESRRWLAKTIAWTDALEAAEKRNIPVPGFHLHNDLEASILSREVALPTK
jgi:predicted Zn-dependent protease